MLFFDCGNLFVPLWVAKIVTIQCDKHGLYVVVDYAVCRAFYGTYFSEGDVVKVHRFMDSRVGVGAVDIAYFRRYGTFEYWSTTPIWYDDHVIRRYRGLAHSEREYDLIVKDVIKKYRGGVDIFKNSEKLITHNKQFRKNRINKIFNFLVPQNSI